jgi:nitroreductase/NAD-dependent dihydropyrimidine dehydrogenase PreA subunit
MQKQIKIAINPDKCNGCGLCVGACPCRALVIQDEKAVVSGTESIGCGHCEAICPKGAIKINEEQADFSFSQTDNTYRHIPPGDFDLSSLICLMRSRRSYRNYTAEPVDPAQLNDLVLIGITAPSGTNSQCWTFSLLPDREKVIALGDAIALYFKRLNKIAGNPLLRIFDKVFSKGRLENYYRNHYTSVRKSLDLWYREGHDQLFHGATAVIIVGSKPEASCPHDDALLATQNILLGAHAMGLGSCLIGYAVHALNNYPKIKKELNIPLAEHIYSVIALGHPAEKYLRPIGRRAPLVRTL